MIPSLGDWEPPASAELTIDTAGLGVEDAGRRVLRVLDADDRATEKA